MKRLVTLAAGLLAVGLLAGCSGSGSEAAPVMVELSSTTSSTAAPTTTSTTEATTTTVDPNIALVEAAYRGYHEAFYPEGEVSVDIGLERFAADPLLSRVLSSLHGFLADGITVGANEYKIHILEIDVGSHTATVRSCDLDAVSLVDSAGEVWVHADPESYVVFAQFELIDGMWRMVERGYEGGTGKSCEAG